MSFRDSFDKGFVDDDCWNDEELNEFRDDRRLRKRQYSEAFGNYRGGYSQGPFRPGPPPPPRGPFGPPPLLGPRMFPPGPMGPPTILGRGFGPSGPPLQKAPKGSPAIRYLIRCGLTRKEVMNLPKGLLDLIEPQHCGLCGQSFEAFALSRVHYISKNHQKSVKKWLSRTSTMPTFNPHEAPFRARDIYCELCDVDITSKQHAVSHYDGKSHRSIVEGRKNPKNPMLLQPGMERRLKNLIRREKKHLSKTTGDTEPKEEDVKDVKPVQPDLYCEICKTAVTCTEQMTAHLNGKRHLKQEKNFILKSMRGEIDAPAARNGSAPSDAVEMKKEKEDEKMEEEEEKMEEEEAWQDWE